MNTYGYWHDFLFVDQLQKALNNNNLVAGTSDTVPGLLAPLTKEGKEKLDTLKHRETKPYLVLVGSLEQASFFSESFSDPRLLALVTTYWPGPLTVIVPAKKTIPHFICSPEHTIALRVPAHEGLLHLLKSFKGLFSTSANLSGQPVASSVRAIDPHIKEQVAFLVDDTEPVDRLPSTIVSYHDGVVTTVRQGAIKL